MMDQMEPSLGGVKLTQSHERRASPRYPYQHKTLCQPQADAKNNFWLMGTSQDISLAGIGFTLHRLFDPGTLLSVDLERPKKDSWGTFHARVMRSTLQADGNWVLGCALLPAMSEEELLRWLNGHGKKTTGPG